MAYCPVSNGKRSFHSEAEAKVALERIAADPHTEIIPIRSYHCPPCGKWHLTHKPIEVTALHTPPMVSHKLDRKIRKALRTGR